MSEPNEGQRDARSTMRRALWDLWPGERGRVSVDAVLRIVVLSALLVTAVQSVVVPRGLYADGAYNLWRVLNEQSYVIIGDARAFAIVLNQTPVVLALNLGVHDLDQLIAWYTFGVAALPIILWVVALIAQWKDRFFWPLVVLYAAAFLPAGFIAIGEYTFSFALTGVVIAVLVTSRPVRGWRAVALVLASTALVASYEGMVFLAIPALFVAIVRLVRPRWLGLPASSKAGRVVLGYTAVASLAAIGVAGASMIVRSSNSADTNLAGALNVTFALTTNLEWRIAAALAVLLVLTPVIGHRLVRTVVQVVLAGASTLLFLDRYHSPVWLHYNTRSLAAMTYAVLVGLALLVALYLARRPAEEARWGRTTGWGYALAASGVMVALSVGFWQSNAGYAAWLADLRDVVVTSEGPVDIAATGLYVGERSQYSWGWTNPYLSALYQEELGQGMVISHVDTLDTFAGISPAPRDWFFDTYTRD